MRTKPEDNQMTAAEVLAVMGKDERAVAAVFAERDALVKREAEEATMRRAKRICMENGYEISSLEEIVPVESLLDMLCMIIEGRDQVKEHFVEENRDLAAQCDVLRDVANIAHAGGLNSVRECDALTLIRRLTSTAWDGSGTPSEQARRVAKSIARAEARNG